MDDINGDGHNDVLFGNEHTISWYDNADGTGALGVSKNIFFDSNFDIQSDLTVGDLDGDGDLDILFYERNQDKFSWLENLDGLGNFSSEQIIIYPNQTYNFNPTIADVNGDGANDIIYFNANDEAILWIENIPDQGTFSSEAIIIDNLNTGYHFRLSDIDSDGDLDIVTSSGSVSASNSNYKISWYENTNGQGSFENEHIVQDGINSYISGIETVALNMSDNTIDIIAYYGYSDNIVWFSNVLGDGNFSTSQIIGNSAYDARKLKITDVDGDGDQDILTASADDIHWYEQTLNGVFAPKQFIANVSNNAIGKIDANLIDSDQNIDVITASDLNDTISWYSNVDGDGSSWEQNTLLNRYAYGPTPLDFDGDGDKDFLAYSSTNEIALFKSQNGLGDFELFEKILLPYNIGKITGFEDFDGDGDIDLPVSADGIVLLKNDGEGHFGNEQVISTIGSGYLFASDVDGDNDMDLLSAIPYHGFYWHENVSGQGDSWTDHLIDFETDEWPSITVSGDCDNDGDLDIITVAEVGMYDQAWIDWYENMGNGNFNTSHHVSTNLLSLGSIYPIDIDNDGDLDLLTYGWTSYDGSTGKVVWHENIDGQGHFNSEHLILNLRCRFVKAIDFDLDNDIDLVCIDKNNVLFWLENTDGLGNFSNQQIISNNSYTKNSMTPIDLDGDLDIDIMLNYPNSNTILWLERDPELSVSEIEPDNFLIYPNPTQDLLTAEYPKEISSIKVYNQVGQLVLTSKNNKTINVSRLNNGLYFITVEAIDGNSSTKKIIKN